jgi:class 3 adenylate cyclase
MSHFRIVLFFALAGFSLSASANPADPRADTTSITQHIEWLIQHGNTSNNTNLDSALYYSNQAVDIAEAANHALQGDSYLILGRTWANRTVADSAEKYFNKALLFFKNTSDSSGIARAYGKLLFVESFLRSNYDRAMIYGYQSLDIWERIGNPNGLAAAYNDLAGILQAQKRYDASNEMLQKAIALIIQQTEPNQGELAYGSSMLAQNFMYQQQFDSALVYNQKVIDIYNQLTQPVSLAVEYNNRGNMLKLAGRYEEALEAYTHSLKLGTESKFETIRSALFGNIGHVHLLQVNYSKALPYTLSAVQMMEEAGMDGNLVENYTHLAAIYAGLGRTGQAYNYQRKAMALNDSIFTIEKEKIMTEMAARYESRQQEKEIVAQREQLEQKDKLQRLSGYIGALMILVLLLLTGIALGMRHRIRFIKKAKQAIEVEKERSESLLLNILPAAVAEELKEKGAAKARLYDEVSVLFTDFKDFTIVAEKMNAQDLVAEIHYCFKKFDEIITRYGIEKIKTIGDAYMCAGGLPVPGSTHARDVVMAALEIQEFMTNERVVREKNDQHFFELRIGIHTGPVVAGIVGIKKFQYDIWGDTVNTAHRMEMGCEPGQVNISRTTYEKIKRQFKCIPRGKIAAKHKGLISMYYVEGLIKQ